MAITTNPFEPPRTLDLDAASGAPREPMVVPKAALNELADGAAWVRRLARVTAAFLAVDVLSAIATLSRPVDPMMMITPLLGIAADTTIAALLLMSLRRYAYASERIQRGDDSAVGQIVGAQSYYFKVTAIAVVLGTCLWLWKVIAYVVACRLRLEHGA
jgi:hypothetical protein